MADQPTLEDFRTEVTAFLERHAPRHVSVDEPFQWGVGSDEVAVFEEADPETERRQLVDARAWRALRYDAGLGWITGPKTYGGRELTAAHDRLYNEIEAEYEVPSQAFFGLGLGMVAPTILAHAQDPVRDRYLPGMFRGDVIGAQLFSEPAAGSDLAGLQTRAERDGEEWVITGQKVWTSGAHYADIGEIICRTDPDQPKHKGLTGFVIDMRAPGVEVRPLRQMTGGSSFNEVFLDGVRVPDDHRLDEVSNGWKVAMTTLLNERASIGSGEGGVGTSGFDNAARLIESLRHFGLADDPVHRQHLSRLYAGLRVVKLHSQRLTEAAAGGVPGPELSTAKLLLTRNMRAICDFVGTVLGPRLLADSGEWGTYAWNQFLLGVPGMRIAGGTDEVLKKILAEQVLGLPKEPGIDTTSPFKDLLRN